MKRKLVLYAAAGLLVGAILGWANPASADAVYPYQNPTYIPAPTSAPVTLGTGASTSTVFTTNNLGTVTLRVSGTCTSLAAAIEATSDSAATKTNWTAINFYAPPALGTAAAAIDVDGSLTAAGLYKINASGYTQLRLNISALAGTSCVVQWSGSNASFNGSFY